MGGGGRQPPPRAPPARPSPSLHFHHSFQRLIRDSTFLLQALASAGNATSKRKQQYERPKTVWKVRLLDVASHVILLCVCACAVARSHSSAAAACPRVMHCAYVRTAYFFVAVWLPPVAARRHASFLTLAGSTPSQLHAHATP